MWVQIAAIFIAIYLWFRHRYGHWKRLGFPYAPASIPFGSSSEVGRTKHNCDVLKEYYEKFKNEAPAFGFYTLTRPMLVPTDPDLIKEIFVKSFETFHHHGFELSEKADPLSTNLFFVNGQEWKDLRAKLSPTFTSGRMKMMFPNVLRAADRMIDYLNPYAKDSQPLEMKEIYSSFTTEVIADVAFGLEVECLGNPNNQFRKMGKAVFEPSVMENLKIFFIMSYPNLAKKLNLGFNTKETLDFFMSTVRDTLNYREKNNVHRNDFFQLLMNIKDSEEGLSFVEMASNSFVFFLAGFETSSSVMTFATYELALNLDIQERLRDEINEILAQHNGEVTYDAIMEMKYLDMVFNETLRKYPGVDAQTRMAMKDFQIPNTKLVIPKDTFIMIPVYPLHNDERFYPNPDKFDPERFTPENIQKRHHFTYIPFSEGPRICIGLRFGTMQAKIGLINLLRNYKISTCSKTTIPMKYVPNNGFMSPQNGMWLKLEKL